MRSLEQKAKDSFELKLTAMILAVMAGCCALGIAEWIPLICGLITLYIYGTG